MVFIQPNASSIRSPASYDLPLEGDARAVGWAVVAMLGASSPALAHKG
jgi:hypothetical protein